LGANPDGHHLLVRKNVANFFEGVGQWRSGLEPLRQSMQPVFLLAGFVSRPGFDKWTKRNISLSRHDD
jgi:hypothetical protein